MRPIDKAQYNIRATDRRDNAICATDRRDITLYVRRDIQMSECAQLEVIIEVSTVYKSNFNPTRGVPNDQTRGHIILCVVAPAAWLWLWLVGRDTVNKTCTRRKHNCNEILSFPLTKFSAYIYKTTDFRHYDKT